eukprot:scaffold6219_cov146-Cylindrotheca_fusiformis.AAC.9
MHTSNRTSNDTNDQEKGYINDQINFPFRIPLVEKDDVLEMNDQWISSSSNDGFLPPPPPPSTIIESFRNDGFCIFPNVLSQYAIDALNDRLEDVLRGIYDRNRKPDKVPRKLKSQKPRQTMNKEEDSTMNETESKNNPNDHHQQQEEKNNKTTIKQSGGIGPIGFSGNYQNVKVLQIINIHKADSLFRKLETNRMLGNIVAQLAGWEQGARLAQDQVWAKPPGAPPLVFHRDSPYFMFEPANVVTVWLALDDMDEELGPLEYVKGSHKWGDGRVGSAKQFFQANNSKNLLQSAATLEGLSLKDLDIVSMAGLKAGGLSIHDGKVWHGSNKNASSARPRRGLGMHFVPANVRFTADANRSSLWKSYVAGTDSPSEVELSEEDFPRSCW